MPDWVRAYDELSQEDRAGGLPPEGLERLADAAFLLGHDHQVPALRERAVQCYLDEGRAEEAAECAFWLGFHLANSGAAAQAAGWIERVRRLVATDPDSRMYARLLQAAAVPRMLAGDAGVLADFEQASVIAHRHQDVNGYVLADIARGRCLTILGRKDEALLVLDEAMVHVVSGRVAPRVAGLAYCSVVAMCMENLDVRRAHEWTRALARWVDDQVGMVPYRGVCLVHRAELLQLHGDWPDAVREADAACVTLRESGESALGSAYYRVAELARLRGLLEVAEQAYVDAAGRGAEVQPGLALLRLRQGRAGAAGAGLDRALAENVPGRARPPLLAAKVEVALATGDVAAAAAASTELSALAEPDPSGYLQALARHAAGAVLLAQGRPRQALVALRSACSSWQALDLPYEAARTRGLLARACRELGDHDAAAMEAAAARSVFQALGAVDPSDVDAGSGTGPLTPREREVIALLATGLSNRSIAQRLVLSDKTVARHLSNIFGKLGVGSRSAATAYAHRHGLVPGTAGESPSGRS